MSSLFRSLIFQNQHHHLPPSAILRLFRGRSSRS
jgi:hypothetical protein